MVAEVGYLLSLGICWFGFGARVFGEYIVFCGFRYWIGIRLVFVYCGGSIEIFFILLGVEGRGERGG